MRRHLGWLGGGTRLGDQTEQMIRTLFWVSAWRQQIYSPSTKLLADSLLRAVDPGALRSQALLNYWYSLTALASLLTSFVRRGRGARRWCRGRVDEAGSPGSFRDPRSHG